MHENDSVSAGQELAVMENPQLRQDSSRVLSELAILDRNLKIAEISGNTSEYQRSLRLKREMTGQNPRFRTEVESAISTLSNAGSSSDFTRGRKIWRILAKRGEVFCKMIAVDRVKIEIPVREYYVPDLKKGQTVKLKLDAYPTATFEGKFEQVSPAIRDRVEALEGTYPQFLATAIISNPEGKLAAWNAW